MIVDKPRLSAANCELTACRLQSGRYDRQHRFVPDRGGGKTTLLMPPMMPLPMITTTMIGTDNVGGLNKGRDVVALVNTYRPSWSAPKFRFLHKFERLPRGFSWDSAVGNRVGLFGSGQKISR